jgi:DNA polymerase III subunit delta
MIYKSYLIEKNIDNIKENLFLFYGENLGLKNDFKTLIKINKKETEFINLTQEEILKNEDVFFSDLFNISLFEKKKIYFINQASDKILDLIKTVEPRIDNQKIYIFSDMLERKSKLRNYFEKSKIAGIAACYTDNETTIKNIILKKLKDFQGLSPQNINTIVDSTNLDRAKLNNELDKIGTYFKDKKIESEKLLKLLNYKLSDNFNLLKDEALNGNKFKTNKLLNETTIDAEKSILYLNLINTRLNKLLEVLKFSKTTNLENALEMIKPPIFWKDKTSFLTQLRLWNLKKINSISKKTYELEIQFKSNSTINKNILIKKLLVDICKTAIF